MTTERERFEAWCRTTNSMPCEHKWIGWQAALSAPPDTESRRAQPEPAASADPSRDAYEGCREDLLDWKRRALKAEETCRQLTRDLGDKVNGPTFMGEPVPPDAAPSVTPEPVAWRYQDARGHYRYRAYKPGFDVEYAILKPVPLYEAHPPRAPLTREALAEIVRSHLTSTYHCTRVWGAWHVGTMTEDDFEPASESDMAEEIADAILAAYPPQAHSVAPEPVAWEGGEGWESLAWELCADENGEDACNELIWEGGPIPEPWGDRWMKYEGEAKRLIALVHKHAAHPPRAPLTDGELWSWTRSVMSQAACIQQDYAAGKFSGYEQYSAHLDAAAATRTDELEARISAHGIGGK